MAGRERRPADAPAVPASGDVPPAPGTRNAPGRYGRGGGCGGSAVRATAATPAVNRYSRPRTLVSSSSDTARG
ncbi:hypothetical protein TPA0907_05880 [Micromonospora humidisoli]|nr:hypothetical protein TPA0907_05880 [Micromonospora sp. AKA109]